ncbi:MAG: DUF1906 domain-containing protein [Paracoccaceae bacterium]
MLMLALVLARPLAAQPVIIDHAFDTRPYLQALKNRGVLAIGRYYARCVGPGQWEEKRMSRAEIDAFELHGMAVLSIYQFWNNSKHKLDGMRVLRDGSVVPTLDADCRDADQGRSAAEEGRLDAEAAVRQARDVGQPQGSAIYFGVDFDFPWESAERATYTAKLTDYFREVNRVLTAAGYRTGSYGNGYAHEVLLEAGLVELTWLSPSPAHSGSIDFFRSRNWNLFQANVDIVWLDEGDCDGMGLDTNIQNPDGPSDIGLWRRAGRYVVPEKITRETFAAMRFVCQAKAAVGMSDGSPVPARICKSRAPRLYDELPHGQAVVAGGEDGGLVAFDLDHDRAFDGWVEERALGDSFWDRPKWVGRGGDGDCR